MAITVGTYANIPGSPSSGDLHFLTDSFYNAVYYNGANSPASWDHLLHGKKLTTPPSFSWINQGGSDTVSSTNGGEALYTPSNGGAHNCRIRKKAAPSTPYVIECAFLPTMKGLDYNYVGPLFRQSSDGKLITILFEFDSGVAKWRVITWNSPSSAGSVLVGPFSTGILVSSPLIFWRLEDDGANRKYHFSGDGINFLQVYSEGRTTFMTADEVGWYANPYSQDVKATLIHWKES